MQPQRLTPSIHLFGPPPEIARTIRKRVRAGPGLPMSVGVARTKHLAKLPRKWPGSTGWWPASCAVVHAESCYGNLSGFYYPARMDKKIVADRLRNADQLIAEQQTEIERFKAEMACLEANGRSTSELRHAVEQIEAALALYIQHREELAKWPSARTS